MENWKSEFDSSKKVEQEIAKKKLYYEDSVHWRQRKLDQSRIEELSMNQEMSPSVVNQLMSEIQELQKKANSLTDQRDFHDPEGSSSYGASHVPTRPLTVPSRSEKPNHEPTMLNDTRNALGISETFLKAYLLEKRIHTSLP